MELYEKISEWVTDKDYVPVSPDELCEQLSAWGSQAEISAVLDKLQEDGIICYTRKGRVASLAASGVLKGVFRSNAKGFGFFIPDEEFVKRTGGDLYISPEDTFDAVNGDIVLAFMKEAAKKDGKGGEGRIIRIVERPMKTVVGTLKELTVGRGKGRLLYVKPDDRRLPFTVTVEGGGDSDVEIGSKVEVQITEYPQNGSDARGKIILVFGDSQSREANYAVVLHENNIRTEFPEDVLAEAEAVAQKPLSLEGRWDLRDKVIFTIDSASAKDLDDAISVERTEEGFLLGVHIADVSEYVRPGSRLDEEALMRGTSVYFADKVVPMLPEVISNGCCSLNADSDKYAMSALISIDKNGDFLQSEVCESIIRSSVRGVYAELNDILEKGDASEFGPKYSPIIDNGSWDAALELYEILKKKSIRRGMMEMETPEAKIIIEDEMPVDIVKVERGFTECLIEQFMLAANEAVATWLFWQDMPCIYRVHDKPDPEKVQSFAVFAHNLGLDITPLRSKEIHATALQNVLEQSKATTLATTVSYMLLRSMAKAQYSPLSNPHFGLGIDKYCHFTSPIRRYPDLAVHRISKMILRGEMNADRLTEMTGFVSDASSLSNEGEIRAVTAERAIDDLYKTIYLSGHVGEVWEGTISSVNSFGLFVELDNTCEGFIPITELDGYFQYDERNMILSCGMTVYSLGKRVKVLIAKTDIVARRTEMRIVEEENQVKKLPDKPLRSSAGGAYNRSGKPAGRSNNNRRR